MIGRKKKPSGHGNGKWENNSSLAKYRRARIKKDKAARKARKANR